MPGEFRISPKFLNYGKLTATVAWSIALLAVVGRIILLPHRATAFQVYQLAGRHWLVGQPLYENIRGFLYGPLIAALLSPLALLRPALGAIVWLIVNGVILFGGIAATLRHQVYPKLDVRYLGLTLLLLLPMTVSNLDIGQANPVLAGLLLTTIAAVQSGRWHLAAALIALAAYLKIYPLFLGILILVAWPGRFGWKFALALVLLGLLPFLLQHWEYVASQYRAWFFARREDDPLKYSIDHAKIDLWLLLVRMGGLSIAPWIYRAFQLVLALMIACYCGVIRRCGWPRRAVLVALLSLGCVWMTIFGPATEGVTYLILAPVIVLALLQALSQQTSTPLRAAIACAYALLLLTAVKNSLVPHLGSWTRALQPAAALIFLAFCLVWLPRLSRQLADPRSI